MICPKCSTVLLMDYTFCPQCGSRLPSQGANPDMDNSESIKAVPEVPAAPAEPVSSGSVFVSSSPLASTMPSPFVSDASDTEFIEPVQYSPVFPDYTSSDSPESEPKTNIQTEAPAQSDAGKSKSIYPELTGKAAVKPEPLIPREYKPLTTAGIFWYMFLVCIPVVGWIVILSFALGGKNRSKKSLSRAILVYWIICILLICLAFIVVFIWNRDLLIQLTEPANWSEVLNTVYRIFINH